MTSYAHYTGIIKPKTLMATKIDTSSITIERIIVHDIPKHLKGNTTLQPKFSEQETNLSDGLRLFFKDKVVSSLGSDKAYKICFDDENSSPASYLIREMLKSDGSNIVDNSTKLTKHLFDIQVGSNTAGIVVTILGKVNSFNSCIILKLERDKGAQLTLDESTRSYTIEEIEDLMLTQKTKIFKVAIFISRVDFGSNYDGLVTDYQIDLKNKKTVTTWFIEKFLGCKPFQDPKITTQLFYKHTTAFIDTIDNIVDRTKYIQDLNSYIQKNSTTMSPKEFADDYLITTAHKNEYKQFLVSKSFSFSSFTKDTTQIDREIKKIVMTFENGISITGNKGTFEDKVTIEQLENGEHKAQITAKIKTVK